MKFTVNIPAYPPRAWTRCFPGAPEGKIFFYLGRAHSFDVWANEQLTVRRTSVMTVVPVEGAPAIVPDHFYGREQVDVLLSAVEDLWEDAK